jgi:hypothetical protein
MLSMGEKPESIIDNIEGKVIEILNVQQIPSRGEIHSLIEQIDSLSQQVDNLSTQIKQNENKTDS